MIRPSSERIVQHRGFFLRRQRRHRRVGAIDPDSTVVLALDDICGGRPPGRWRSCPPTPLRGVRPHSDDTTRSQGYMRRARASSPAARWAALARSRGLGGRFGIDLRAGGAARAPLRGGLATYAGAVSGSTDRLPAGLTYLAASSRGSPPRRTQPRREGSQGSIRSAPAGGHRPRGEPAGWNLLARPPCAATCPRGPRSPLRGRDEIGFEPVAPPLGRERAARAGEPGAEEMRP